VTREPVPLERVWREERAAVVATLARRLGDLQLAEDAVQEAFMAAAARWPADGVPERPGAWLTTTAWRKALDVVRRERLPVHTEATGAEPAAPERLEGDEESDLAVEDDLLGLLLTCCHPALGSEARVALTLRHVAGLTAREIAAAFLVSEVTMDKRLVRARDKIRDARIAFAMPDRDALPERLAAVHSVLYLIFTEGHLASGEGPPLRAELCAEAVWLTRQLHALVPDDAETMGLLALLVLQHARTPARQDGAGRLVPYDEQDRSRWDVTAIAEGRALLASVSGGPLGPYQVQAAIAALHAHEPLNWARVADLYGVLGRLAPSLVVEVNRAVAVGRADGARAGLAVLAPVLAADRLGAYAPLHAAHADLLERDSQPAAAEAAWRRAAHVAANPEQRAELERRAAALSAR
jgi:RNA polymerase sigma-70 factor (ECF subfamily)